MIITRYNSEQHKEWNDFIMKSFNGSFLFNRKYMDYHKDRFEDHSIIIKDKDEWLSVFPGNVYENEWSSHSGLSYGGLVSGLLSQRKILNILSEVILYLKKNGISKVKIKLIPDIYYRYNQQAFTYALFKLGFNLIRRDASSTIFLDEQHKTYKGRISSINRALREGIYVKESNDYKSFIELVNKNLREKYGIKAVHSDEEISLLARELKENIKLIIAKKNSEILAGGIVYIVGHVMHLQYFSTNYNKPNSGAGDLVIKHCLDLCKRMNLKIFDFGSSTEKNGLYLNEGLNKYKESFGAVTTILDHYEKQLDD